MVHNITSKWNAFRNSAAKLQQFGDIREVLITSFARSKRLLLMLGFPYWGLIKRMERGRC